MPRGQRSRDQIEQPGATRNIPWKALVQLWSDAAGAPAHAADGAVVRAMVAIRNLIDARYSFLLFGMLDPPERVRDSLEPITGWRPCGFLRDPDEPPERIELRNSWIAKYQYVHDRGTQAFLRDAGVARVATHRAVAPPGTWKESPSRDLMERLGLSSRMIVAVPLAVTLEAYMGFDREPPATEFEEHAQQTALAAVKGLAPVLLRLARLQGLERGAPLTPREQSLLRALLTGASEKEVAEQVNMTWRSAHRRIADVYRKLGVTTRAELMACFLEGAAKARQPTPVRKRSRTRGDTGSFQGAQ